MGRLSIHVLDITCGRPAAGMKIDLSRLEGESWQPVKSVLTIGDGRPDKPLLADDELVAGCYRLDFHLANYFRQMGATLSDPPFLDVVPIQIGIADTSLHYHVPLLCTPWSYATYRGS